MTNSYKLMSIASIFLIVLSANVLNASPTESVNTTVDKGDEKIVGGENAVRNEFPWLVHITSDLGFCGGSILTENWILTAAHCVKNPNWLPSVAVIVTAGDHVRSETNGLRQVVRSVKVIPHQGYNAVNFVNDIALIKLKTPLNFTTAVKRSILPASASIINSGTAIVAGWGTLREGGTLASDTLQKVELDLVDESTCRDSYAQSVPITENMMCAARPGKDSCQGDSGGPLMCHVNNYPVNSYVCGIVSFGNGCARPTFPGVYTKISSYLSWIRLVLDSDANEPSNTTPTPSSVSSLVPEMSLLTVLIFLTTARLNFSLKEN